MTDAAFLFSTALISSACARSRHCFEHGLCTPFGVARLKILTT